MASEARLFHCAAGTSGSNHVPGAARYLFILPGAATRFRSLAPVYVLVALSVRVFTWGKMGGKTSRSSPRDGRIFVETAFRACLDEGQETFITDKIFAFFALKKNKKEISVFSENSVVLKNFARSRESG